MSQQGSNMNSLIHNFDDLSQKNDLTIRSSITSQKDKLKAKIEEKSKSSNDNNVKIIREQKLHLSCIK